jgi:hypothetical protein
MPLKGERPRLAGRRRHLHLITVPATKKQQARAKTLPRPNPLHATPSPLDGERAGVRGVTHPGVPLAMPALDSFHELVAATRSPLLAPP